MTRNRPAVGVLVEADPVSPPAAPSPPQGTPAAVLIAVPLYKAPELVGPLFSALAALAEEIAGIGARVVLINDSPDHAPLREALAAALPRLREAVDVELLTNARNLGFVGAANRALRLGLDTGADVILLNSDALPTPGAFAELAAVAASDPMIGVVSPRSDNATLCNSPYPDIFRGLEPAEALRAHRAVQRYLPRVTYAPTAVGFCLYVRRLMLQEFGLFDEVYGGGYNEENDFVMRCNRFGYRAVLANHAFVHHLGGVSFAQSDAASAAREAANREILLQRHPHYNLTVRRWFAGTEHRAQWLLAGLVPDRAGRLRVLLDARNLDIHHNGTFEHTRALFAAFAEAYGAEFSLHLACSPAAASVHGLDRIAGLTLCEAADLAAAPFAAAFRVSQPFSPGHLGDLGDLAPLTGFLFLDTIAMDCQDLDIEDLQRTWSWMAQTVALIGFNSAFTAQQFRRRFDLPPEVVDFVSLCSTDVAEYAPQPPGETRGDSILVVGNHYAHKYVAQTVAALQARTDRALVVLGAGDRDLGPGVRVHRAGDLEQAQVDGLYDAAGLVVFPSHYEGFGLPVMHALARGRPVVARDLAPYREIAAKCGEAVNLHLRPTTADIVETAAAGVGRRTAKPGVRPQTWADAAGAVRDAILEAVRRCDYASVHTRVARLERCRPSEAPAPAKGVRVLKTAVSPAELARRRSALGSRPEEPTGSGRVEDEGETPSARDGAPAPAGVYRIEDATLADETLLAGLLERAAGMPYDEGLTLDAAADELDADRAERLLITAGLSPGAAEVVGGRLRITSRIYVRWSESVPAGGEDRDFVEASYLAVQGRPSDPSGLQNYVGELANGLGRRAMLKIFYGSPERRALIAAWHGLEADDPGSRDG